MTWTPNVPEPDQVTEDRWLRVWLLDGDSLCVRLDEESRIDAAVQCWIDMERDAILYLTTIGERQVAYRASQIVGWTSSTPESRALEAHQEARDAAERRENRQAAGLPFEGD